MVPLKAILIYETIVCVAILIIYILYLLYSRATSNHEPDKIEEVPVWSTTQDWRNVHVAQAITYEEFLEEYIIPHRVRCRDFTPEGFLFEKELNNSGAITVVVIGFKTLDDILKYQTWLCGTNRWREEFGETYRDRINTAGPVKFYTWISRNIKK